MKMLNTILRNFTGKSATRLYPFEEREPFENARGELKLHVDDCIFCGKCAKKCPSQCISVSRPEASWEFDPFACVFCGVCVDVCPKTCLVQDGKYLAPSQNRQYVYIQDAERKKKQKPKKAA